MVSYKFKKIINKIVKTKRKFNKFDSQVKQGIYLRFDVDISINNALKISKFLKSKHIIGNFFFQPNNEIYNIFNTKNKNIINQIKKDGHLIGLHVDENFFSITEKNILNILNFFRNNGYKFSNVISFHRPSKSILKKKYKNLINTYEENFFNKDIYISDSGKNIFFENNIDNFLKNKNKAIQILLHPVWWTNIKTTKNFPKVFRKFVLKKNFLTEL